MTTQFSSDYVTTLADAGGSFEHVGTDTSARKFTISDNFPVDTRLDIFNSLGAGLLTIAGVSDLVYLAGETPSGTVLLDAPGAAVAIKDTSTSWTVHAGRAVLGPPPVVPPVPVPPISLTSSVLGSIWTHGSSAVMTLPSANAGDLIVVFCGSDAPSGSGTNPAQVADIGNAGVQLGWTKVGNVWSPQYPAANMDVWYARTPIAQTNLAIEVDLSPDSAAIWIGSFSHVDQTTPFEGSMLSDVSISPGYAVISGIPCSKTGLILAADVSSFSPVPVVYPPLTSLGSTHGQGSNGSYLNVGSYKPGAAGMFSTLFGPNTNHASAAIVLKNG